jgi:hypothetical protein
MRIFQSIKRRLADATGAVTEEFSFLTVVALAIVAVLIVFIKSPVITGLLVQLFQNLFEHLTAQIMGLFS